MNNSLRVIFVIIFSSGIVFMALKDNLLELKIADQRIRVEVATKSQEHALGLMNRYDLKENRGMLFVYNQEKELSFWMKDTFIPLDIIFIDEDKMIVHIEKNAQPCTEADSKDCQKYQTSVPAKYVLELNSGFIDTHAVTVGSFVEF